MGTVDGSAARICVWDSPGSREVGESKDSGEGGGVGRKVGEEGVEK